MIIGTHYLDMRLRSNDAKVCLLGDLERLKKYNRYDNPTSLGEADFVVVLGENDNDIPNMLLHLAQDLCPHDNNEDEQRFAQEAEKLVLKMHQLTPPKERNLLWQRYFHARAQATPDAQDVFRRMAENQGLIQRQFKTVKQVPTGHFRVGTGTVINWTDPPRGHNFVGYIK